MSWIEKLESSQQLVERVLDTTLLGYVQGVIGVFICIAQGLYSSPSCRHKGVEKYMNANQQVSRPQKRMPTHHKRLSIDRSRWAMHLLDINALTLLTHPDSHANLKTAIIEIIPDGNRTAEVVTRVTTL